MIYSRLKKNAEVQYLFKKGRRAYSSSLTAVYLPSNATAMAVIVSKKHGKAVRRNRIKRLLRQAFYNKFDKLPFACNILLIPRVSEEYSLASFERAIEGCFKKMR